MCTVRPPKASKTLSLNLSALFASLKADHKALAFLGVGNYEQQKDAYMNRSIEKSGKLLQCQGKVQARNELLMK